MLTLFTSLRRRFEQNQEDCTYTVLALLPTATENIVQALPVEEITHELQQRRTDRIVRSSASSEIAPSEAPTGAEEDSRSSVGGSSYIHASQMAGDEERSSKPRKTKIQLWDDLKISGGLCLRILVLRLLTQYSNHASFHPNLYTLSTHSPHPYTTQSTRSKELPVQCSPTSLLASRRLQNQPRKLR